MEMTTKEVLIKAKSLIEKEENWYQGAFFDPGDYNCMCGLGAVVKAIDPDATYLGQLIGNKFYFFNQARQALCAVIPTRMGVGFGVFNDDPKTKHIDVLEAFDRAIAKEDSL